MVAEFSAKYPALPAYLPALAVCGRSGSGKTTLIESALSILRQRGLAVAVLKHDVHGVQVDRRGKDSDRFFRAGADVLLHGPGEQLIRFHSDGRGWADGPADWLRWHDLALLEGWKNASLPKVWLLSPGESRPPRGVRHLIGCLPRGAGRVEAFLSILDGWLPKEWVKTPVFGCVLPGRSGDRGGARRQVRRAVELLRKVTERVVVVGEWPGRPRPGTSHTRGRVCHIGCAPDIEGPMAGILSALRWSPEASWLVAPCNSPHLNAGRLEWLLASRRPGIWAILPRFARNSKPAIAPAYYDPRSRILLEGLRTAGGFRLDRVAGSPKVITPTAGAAVSTLD